MTLNLREKAESLLSLSLEGPFALPVYATGPDGVENQYSGQILSDRVVMNPDTGEVMIVVNPVVVLRRSSLVRIPQDGEIWYFKIPLDPSRSGTLLNFIFDGSDSVRGGRSIGFIRIPLKFIEQSS